MLHHEAQRKWCTLLQGTAVKKPTMHSSNASFKVVKTWETEIVGLWGDYRFPLVCLLLFLKYFHWLRYSVVYLSLFLFNEKKIRLQFHNSKTMNGQETALIQVYVVLVLLICILFMYLVNTSVQYRLSSWWPKDKKKMSAVKMAELKKLWSSLSEVWATGTLTRISVISFYSTLTNIHEQTFLSSYT